MPPSEYNEEKREQLKALADSIGQSHFTRSVVEKNREQAARQLEDQLRTDLNEIIEKILHDDTNDISQLQRNYSVEVEHVIRAAVSNAYSIGINYVGETKKKPNQMFVTGTDLNNIKALTNEFNHTFWRRVSAVLHQKDTVQNILKNARFSPRSKLSLSNLISSLAVKIITKSLAHGTVSKVNQLSKIQEPIKSAQFVDVFVWKTMNDERVCPLCASLDGMEWAYSDPDMLMPGDEDTHPNCRCTLNLKPIDDTTE